MEGKTTELKDMSQREKVSLLITLLGDLSATYDGWASDASASATAGASVMDGLWNEGDAQEMAAASAVILTAHDRLEAAVRLLDTSNISSDAWRWVLGGGTMPDGF